MTTIIKFDVFTGEGFNLYCVDSGDFGEITGVIFPYNYVETNKRYESNDGLICISPHGDHELHRMVGITE